MPIPTHIQQAIQAYYAERCTPDDLASLEDWLREDEAHVRIFAELGMLEWQMICEQQKADAAAIASVMREADERAADALDSNDSTALAKALEHLAMLHEEGMGEPVHLEPTPPFSLHSPVSKATKRKARLIIAGGLAAVIAISAAVALVVSLLAQPTQNTTIVEQPADERIIVATLTDTHDAEWDQQKPGGDHRPGSSDHRPGALRQGTQLAVGQRLTLTQGFAEITTNDGAIALIEAPATIELIDNDNAIYLHEGKLIGICETESSKGFVVRTAHMDITDIGTEFGVDVSNDTVTATVFSGEVELTTPDNEPQPLTENQTARLTVDGSNRGISFELSLAEGFDDLQALTPSAAGDTLPLPGTGQGLAVGDTDPNWQIVAVDGKPLDTPRLLRVVSNRYYNGQFANDPATSQWLSFKPAEQDGNEHAYQVRTVLDLPQDISENGALLRLTYMADNAIRSVTVNGHRVVLPEIQWTDGRNGYAPFQHAVIERHLVPGRNTFKFELVNIGSDTGLRVAWELSDRINQPEETPAAP